MPSRSVPLVNGLYYHIFNRVSESKKLFYSQADYISYLTLWQDVDFSTCCKLIAYCLMPNHYHYLLQITDERLFPRKLSYFFNKYLKSLNTKRNEQGRYFENRFKAKVIEDERYLVGVCCYIHLNPVKANLVLSPRDWPFSNYLEFIGRRKGVLWDRLFLKEYFQSPSEYEEFIKSEYDETEVDQFGFDRD